MNAWHLRPLRWAWACGAALIMGSTFTSWHLGANAAGQGGAGPLPKALEAVATLEASRLGASLGQSLAHANATLDTLLDRTVQPAAPPMAVPWVAGGCAHVPAAVERTRAGVWDVAHTAPLMLLEWPGERCVDRLGGLAVAAVTGPPFPTLKDLERAATQTQWGTGLATGNGVSLLSIWRDGERVMWRLGKMRGERVAFVDALPGALPAPAALTGVALHSFVTVDGVVAGYVHGGPRAEALVHALKGVTQGLVRALDLPDLAAQSAGVPVLQWLGNAHGTGALAFGVQEVVLWDASPKVVLTVLASAAWPAAQDEWSHLLVILLLAAGALAAGMGMLFGGLGKAVMDAAHHTQRAWMGLRDDDEGTQADAVRAQAWLEQLCDTTQATLVAALGRRQKFWAHAPVQRLLGLVRKRLREN